MQAPGQSVQALRAERGESERRDILLNLFRPACADERRCDGAAAQRPLQGHLSKRLPAGGGNPLQLLYTGVQAGRQRFRFEIAGIVANAAVPRNAILVFARQPPPASGPKAMQPTPSRVSTSVSPRSIVRFSIE